MQNLCQPKVASSNTPDLSICLFINLPISNGQLQTWEDFSKIGDDMTGIRVAQNAPKVKNLQGDLFHSCFFQVGEKNALKPAKNWWLGVAPGLAILSSIYLIDISEKWQILVEIIFDPSSCLENMNKHRETTWHIPKPHQGPKEHQNRALRSNFMNLEVTMSLKLGHFLTFFSISSNI